ncbi:hypothetical protein BT69DRAFT_1317243 [Atractiella rhizophila]|nr:hypothetical protein BT69DRAFT_1317243 [Atractiella rhizophila]
MAESTHIYYSKSHTYSPFVLPSYPSGPLQLTADGSLIITTNRSIYIVTPSLFLGADVANLPSKLVHKTQLPSAAAAADLEEEDELAEFELAGEDFECFKTEIEIMTRDTLTTWENYSNDPRSVSQGPVEPAWKMAIPSPSFISPLGTCIIAALTTNHDVLIYSPSKNAHRGEWIQSATLTPLLLDSAFSDTGLGSLSIVDKNNFTGEVESAKESLIRAGALKRAQTVALAWAPALTHGQENLLLLAQKSGDLALWKCASRSDFDLLSFWRPEGLQGWITGLAWMDEWLVSSTNNRVNYVAISTSFGHVFILKITFSLQEGRNLWETRDVQEIHGRDDRTVTSLKWIIDGDCVRLVFSKVGQVHLASWENHEDLENNNLQSIRSLDLPSMGSWDGASPWAPIVGLNFSVQSQTLLTTLSSALTYVVSVPELTIDDSSSQTLSLFIRSQFETIEKEKLLKVEKQNWNKVKGFGSRDLMRCFGFVSGPCSLAWYIYKKERPQSLGYRADKLERTTIMTTNLFGGPKSVKDELSALLQKPPTLIQESSALTLFPYLLYFTQNMSDPQVLREFLNVAQEFSAIASHNTQPERGMFEDNLIKFILLDKELQSLRLVTCLAKFILVRFTLGKVKRDELKEMQDKCQVDDELKTKLQTLTYKLRTNMNRCLYQRLLSALQSEAADILQWQDQQLLLRLQRTTTALQAGALDPVDPDAFTATPDSSDEREDDLCPACESSIPFQHLRYARCPDGHIWDRCSVTLKVIVGTKNGTCTGCGRKSLLSAADIQESYFKKIWTIRL